MTFRLSGDQPALTIDGKTLHVRSNQMLGALPPFS